MPAEEVRSERLVLRRVQVDDADGIATAVSASLDYLRPWMPWATLEAAEPRTQRIRVAEADELWEAGTDFIYSVLLRPELTVIGEIGLHRRAGDGRAGDGRAGDGRAGDGRAGDERAGDERAGDERAGDERAGDERAGDERAGDERAGDGRAGDGGMEIGYWIDTRYSGRGLGTEAAGLLTDLALALPGVTRTEIHCDVANQASAAIPRKLGYQLDRVEPQPPEAPGERGHRMVWVLQAAG
jgi:RimJ/RimL family protein N-acetyltransferase